MVTSTTPSATNYANRTAELQKFWEPRNSKFREWYKRLRLENNLKQTNMESFIGNDPRTLFNLALYLLTPKPVPHNIPIEGLGPVDIQAISTVEAIVRQAWVSLDREQRNLGHQDWLSYTTKMMLATGWYSVLAMTTETGFVADVWNPASTFPDYSDGLQAVAHVYTLSRTAANSRATAKGWTLPSTRSNAAVKVTDFWEMRDGEVYNAILFDQQFVKTPTAHAEFTTIPVLVSPIGGLPDNGSIDEGDDWKTHVGESIVATNHDVYENYNRQLTFLQQILRDTAQPRFKERSKSGRVMNPDDVFKRGAVFKMDIDEDVGVIDMPSIPVELRTQIFDAQGMLQRGGLPWSLYGGQGEVAAFAASLAAASANQILQPYRQALSFLLTDVDNTWLTMMRNGQVPQNIEFPNTLPDQVNFDVDIKVQIPGDMALRATTARQMDPNFRMSRTTVYDLMFPEIRDPNREIAAIQRDAALESPVASQIALILGLKEQALAMQVDGNMEGYRLFTTAAQLAEAQLNPQPEQAGPPPGSTTNIVPQQ